MRGVVFLTYEGMYAIELLLTITFAAVSVDR
jgi:hypothetical protein